MLSLDANFRLCRRKNAGKVNRTPPLLENLFFLKQPDVDCYVGTTNATGNEVSEVTMITVAIIVFNCTSNLNRVNAVTLG